MRKITYVKAATLASLVVAASGVAVAPAQAELQPLATCPASHFCLFENKDFGGGMKVYANGESDSDMRDTHYNNGHVVNDTSSSMINHSGHSIVLYRDINSHVICYIASANSEDTSFNNNTCTQDKTKGVNDNISSSAVG